ncbi:MAG: hypothetical protein FWE21_05770 [Defluviitaleaceae bacterium]|nr:hypothetical protein [Defluviitaleaceae bacterium]
MKIATKRIIISIVGAACFAAVFFFFFAPGWLFGGINYITTNSDVRIIQNLYMRMPLEGSNATVFDPVERNEHYLNHQQVVELTHLMRNSWYTRRLGRQISFIIPEEVDHFHTHTIIVDNKIIHSVDWGGRLLRGGSYNNFLRIRNTGWDKEMARIIRMGERTVP